MSEQSQQPEQSEARPSLNKMLITSITRTAEGRIDMTGRGHQYRDLILFDAVYLQDVGIDPTTLPVGVPTPCAFWAIYTISEKLNKAGNPYRDVKYLEPYTNGATAEEKQAARDIDPPVDSSETNKLLAEIRDLLLALLATVTPHTPFEEPTAEAPAQPAPKPELVYALSQTKPTPGAETGCFLAYVADHNGDTPADVRELRSWAKSTGWQA